MESNLDSTNGDSLPKGSIGLLYADGRVLNSSGILMSTDTYLNAVTPHAYEAGSSQYGLRTPVYALNSSMDNEQPSGKH